MPLTRRGACCWLLLTLFSTPCLAEEDASENDESSRGVAPQCQSANALSAIACELRRRLPPALDNVVVVAARIDAPGEVQLDELSQRLAEVVAGRFDVAEHFAPASLSGARARPTRANYLLHLSPRINGAHFEVTSNLYPVPRSFWDRAKPAPGPLQHAFATRRMDAEIGSFLPVPKLVGKVEHVAKGPTSNVVAMACGDVDGDRSLELLVVGRQELVVGRVRGGRLTPTHKQSWQDLSPIAPAPLREPIGTVHIRTGIDLLVGLSDRAEMVRLSPQLEVLERTPGKQPWGDLGCTEREGLGLTPVVSECNGTRTWERLDQVSEIDAVAGGTFETTSGNVRVVAGRRRGAALLQLTDGDGRSAQVSDAGAQVAVSDLNRDGVIEVMTSNDTLEPKRDALRVQSWQPDGLEPVFELSVPGGIDALTTCPPEDLTASMIVVATGDELWFVR